MTEVHEPQWLRIAAIGPVLGIMAFGAVGLALADMGLYTPILEFPLALLALAGLVRLARPVLGAGRAPSAPSRAGARFAIAISVGYAMWNGVNASQHVQINRDGAVYLNAGKWIAVHGNLQVDPYVGAFARGAPVIATSTGMGRDGGHLEFSLSHMLSALLAVAQNLGGDHLMFLTVPILSGLSLLLFYLLAHKLLRHPFAALAAVLTLAFLMPQISFSRDSTTEIPLQVLLFAAVWLLCDPHTIRSRGTAFCAGLMLGLIEAMHVDGIAFLLGLPLVYALLWLRAKRSERPTVKRGIRSSSIGVVIGIAFAGFDALLADHHYISALKGNVERLAAAEVLVVAAVLLGVYLLPRRADLVARMRESRERTSDVLGGLVLVAGLGLWIVRPYVQTTHAKANAYLGFIQQSNRLTVDPTRRYYELSVRWIGWYLGPLTVMIAIIAAAALVRAIVRGSVRVPVLVPALLFAPPALLYIWKPNITPDQVWAARRFVPAVFPGVILLTFGTLSVLARDRDRSYAAERRFGAIVLAVAAAAFPLYTIRSVSQMTEQRGLFPEITSICHMTGPNSAIVMLQEPRSVAYLSDPQTLRSFCDVPVAVMLKPIKPLALRVLATSWAAQGRRLFVVAQFPATIQAAVSHAKLLPTPVGENTHLLEATLTHRPRKYTSERLQLTAAAVPPLSVPAPSK